MIFWYDLNWGPIQHGGWVNWYPFFSDVLFGFDVNWFDVSKGLKIYVSWSWRFLWWKLKSYDKIHQNPQIECCDSPITRGLGAKEKSARKKQPCFNKQAKNKEKSQLLLPPIFLPNSLGCPDKITIFRPTSWPSCDQTLISKTTTLRSQTYGSFGLTPFKDSKSSIIITFVTWLHFWRSQRWQHGLGILGKLQNVHVFSIQTINCQMLLMIETESTLLPHPSLAPMAKRSASSGKRHWAWGKKRLQANWKFANCNVSPRPHLSKKLSRTHNQQL